MRPLELDFLRTKPATPLVAWLLLALGIALTLMVLSRYSDVKTGLADETALAAQYERDQRKKPSKTRDAVAAVEPAHAEQALLDKPWGEFFARLERTRPGTIAFLAIDADGRKGDAEITAEARTPGQMLDYVNGLQNQPGFSSVNLTSHIIDDENPQRPVQFMLHLKWSGHEARP
jgi:hypothetical protein